MDTSTTSAETNWIKVAVTYRSGLSQDGVATQKVWRFNSRAVHSYTVATVEEDLLHYFPAIREKGYGLTLFYQDSFVGEVKVESDRDLQVASYNYRLRA